MLATSANYANSHASLAPKVSNNPIKIRVLKFEIRLDLNFASCIQQLDFDRTVSSLKCSSCAVEHMRASLNKLLNYFDQFKVNLFVHGAGRRLLQRDERLLAVVSLSFGVGETNCLQGSYAANGVEVWLECKGTRHQWSGPEAKTGTRLRDRRLDGCYRNQRQSEAL